MTRNRDVERAFEQDVERLLRGEEPSGTSLDAQYEDTLQFARRLLSLRDEPNREFADRLRGRLMVEMAQQDMDSVEREGSWFVRLFSKPSLRLAVVSGFVILAAVGLVWRAGYLSPMTEQMGGDLPSEVMDEGGSPAPTLEEAGPEMVRIADEEAEEEAPMAPSAEMASPVQVGAHVVPSNSYGEDVQITLVFENAGPEGITLFPFPPAVTVRNVDSGEAVWTLPAGESSLMLSSMESTTYNVLWDQETDRGVQVPAGRYVVDIREVQAETENKAPVPAAGTLEIVVFEILPPK